MGLNPISDAAVELVKSTVGRVVGQLADHYLPASMSEKEKEEFKLKAAELAEREYEANIAFTKTINETMQAEAKSEHWIQYSWRPMVGFTFIGVIINNFILIPYASALGLGVRVLDIPEGIWSAMLVILGVAAGTRGLQKWQAEKNK